MSKLSLPTLDRKTKPPCFSSRGTSPKLNLPVPLRHPFLLSHCCDFIPWMTLVGFLWQIFEAEGERCLRVLAAWPLSSPSCCEVGRALPRSPCSH